MDTKTFWHSDLKVPEDQAVPSMGFPKNPEKPPVLATYLLESQQEDGCALPFHGITDLPLPNQGKAAGLPYELVV